METREEQRGTYAFSPHKSARPMVIIRDEKGDPWLCDKGIDPGKDLREQGCWQCGGTEMAFTRND